MNVQDRQTIKQHKKVLLSLVFNQSIECHPFLLSTLLFIGFIILCYRCMFTLYLTAFAPPGKSSWIGLLFTRNNLTVISLRFLYWGEAADLKSGTSVQCKLDSFSGQHQKLRGKVWTCLYSRKMDGACLGLKFAKRATLKAWEKISVLCESFFFFSAPVINCEQIWIWI